MKDRERSKRVERSLGYAQSPSGRSLPLLLKLEGGAGSGAPLIPPGQTSPVALVIMFICIFGLQPEVLTIIIVHAFGLVPCLVRVFVLVGILGVDGRGTAGMG